MLVRSGRTVLAPSKEDWTQVVPLSMFEKGGGSLMEGRKARSGWVGSQSDRCAMKGRDHGVEPGQAGREPFGDVGSSFLRGRPDFCLSRRLRRCRRVDGTGILKLRMVVVAACEPLGGLGSG